METSGEFGVPVRSQRFRTADRDLGVHVLSEHVFCPRAAILAARNGRG